MFQLAKEVDELLAGNEEKFKGNVASVDTPSAPLHKAKVVKAPAVPAMPSASHIDAVPQATPINRNRVVHKKVKNRNIIITFVKEIKKKHLPLIS